MGTRKDARRAGREPSLGQAGKRGPPPPDPPPAPRRTRSQVRQAPLPAWARPGVSSCRAAPPPPSLGACAHSPRGFTFGPGPCRLPAPGELQRQREEGELRAGEATPGEPRRSPGSERGAPAAVSLRPSSPHTLSERGWRAGAPSGDPLAAARGRAAPWGKRVRSPWGHRP